MIPPIALQSLEREIGLDAQSIGESAIAAAISDRVRATGAGSAEAYASRWLGNPAEFQALVNRVVVPETWFFRMPESFAEIERRAREVAAEGRTFRAACIPCSTGEEPYSLALTLGDSGLSPDAWEIDAADASTEAVAAARRGIYREPSMRSVPTAIRDRHFRAGPGGWELSTAIRDRVRITTGNVLDSTLFEERAGEYDAVFCRNLLIYLTPAARSTALDHLTRLLRPDGVLAVGHAEPGCLANRGFAAVGSPAAFTFARTAAPAPASILSTWNWSPPAPVPAMPAPAKSPQLPPTPTLSDARDLANRGDLTAALAECQRIVTVTPSADGYALLGTILLARGDRPAARAALRKALYLDPNHPEALAQSLAAALAEGDATQAAALRARLDKLPRGADS